MLKYIERRHVSEYEYMILNQDIMCSELIQMQIRIGVLFWGFFFYSIPSTSLQEMFTWCLVVTSALGLGSYRK